MQMLPAIAEPTGAIRPGRASRRHRVTGMTSLPAPRSGADRAWRVWERRHPRHRTWAGSRCVPAERCAFLSTGALQLSVQGAAEIARGGHERCPLPAGADAGRRIRSGNSDRAGAAGRGSRRRGCAVCGLGELKRPSWKLCSVRPAAPMVPNCHGPNIATERTERCPKCHPRRKKPSRFQLIDCLIWWAHPGSNRGPTD